MNESEKSLGLYKNTRSIRIKAFCPSNHEEYAGQTLSYENFKVIFSKIGLSENNFYDLLHNLEINGLIEAIIYKEGWHIQVMAKE